MRLCVDCKYCWAGAPGVPAHCMKYEGWRVVEPSGNCDGHELRNNTNYKEVATDFKVPPDLVIKIEQSQATIRSSKAKRVEKT
jgi:hypothetical protein